MPTNKKTSSPTSLPSDRLSPPKSLKATCNYLHSRLRAPVKSETKLLWLPSSPPTHKQSSSKCVSVSSHAKPKEKSYWNRFRTFSALLYVDEHILLFPEYNKLMSSILKGCHKPSDKQIGWLRFFVLYGSKN